MRFVKQRNQFSCGILAIINTKKWLGLKASYKKDYKKTARFCKTTTDGTKREKISAALDKLSDYLTYEFMYLVTFKQIKEHLVTGGAIILEYFFLEYPGMHDGHYEILMYENEKFYSINGMSSAPAKQIISEDNIKKKLRCKKFREIGSPSAWFLNRL